MAEIPEEVAVVVDVEAGKSDQTKKAAEAVAAAPAVVSAEAVLAEAIGQAVAKAIQAGAKKAEPEADKIIGGISLHSGFIAATGALGKALAVVGVTLPTVTSAVQDLWSAAKMVRPGQTAMLEQAMLD